LSTAAKSNRAISREEADRTIPDLRTSRRGCVAGFSAGACLRKLDFFVSDKLQAVLLP
jgi:hypothetical protein